MHSAMVSMVKMVVMAAMPVTTVLLIGMTVPVTVPVTVTVTEVVMLAALRREVAIVKQDHSCEHEAEKQ